MSKNRPHKRTSSKLQPPPSSNSTSKSPSFIEKTWKDLKAFSKSSPSSYFPTSIPTKPIIPPSHGKPYSSNLMEAVKTFRSPQKSIPSRKVSTEDEERKRKFSSSSSDSSSASPRIKQQLSLRLPPQERPLPSSDSSDSSSSEEDDWCPPKIVRVASSPRNDEVEREPGSDSEDGFDLNLRPHDFKNKSTSIVQNRIIASSTNRVNVATIKPPPAISNSSSSSSDSDEPPPPRTSYKSRTLASQKHNENSIDFNHQIPNLSSLHGPSAGISSFKNNPSQKQKKSQLLKSDCNSLSNIQNKSVLQGIDITLRFSPSTKSHGGGGSSSGSCSDIDTPSASSLCRQQSNNLPITLPLPSTTTFPKKAFSQPKKLQFSNSIPSTLDSSSDSDDDLFNKFIAKKTLERRTSSIKPVTRTTNSAASDSDVEIISINDGSKTTNSDVEVITINDDTKTTKSKKMPPSVQALDNDLIQKGPTFPEMEVENCVLPPQHSLPQEDPLSIVSIQEIEKFVQHQETLKFICPICKRRFITKTVLYYHVNRHKNVKPFRCKVKNCGKSFVRKCDLLAHGRLWHPDPAKPVTTYQCTICDKFMKNARNLRLHVATHYDKTNFCDICGKSFSQPWYLKHHKTMHSEGKLKPFPCPECKDSFLKEASLRKHITRFHTVECTGDLSKDKYYIRQQRKMKLLDIESHLDIVFQNEEGADHPENTIVSKSASSQGQSKEMIENEV